MKIEDKQIKMQKMMKNMCNSMNMDDCQEMMAMMMHRKHMKENHEPAQSKENFATSELQMLFFEWCQQLEDEISQHIEETGSSDLKLIAEKFNLSEASCKYLIDRINSR